MKRMMNIGNNDIKLSRNEMRKIMAGNEALAECQRIAQACFAYSNSVLQGKANSTCTNQFESCAKFALQYY